MYSPQLDTFQVVILPHGHAMKILTCLTENDKKREAFMNYTDLYRNGTYLGSGKQVRPGSVILLMIYFPQYVCIFDHIFCVLWGGPWSFAEKTHATRIPVCQNSDSLTSLLTAFNVYSPARKRGGIPVVLIHEKIAVCSQILTICFIKL